MSISRVVNVEEAVLLAADFKRKSQYDWFRGQIENWPLRSSYVRRGPAEQNELLQKAGRFEQWVKATPGLESLAENSDALIAVAQHYGIPTNFIDFTTDPAIAGFFASDGNPSDPSQLSCIMCLSTMDLQRFWELMPPKYPQPEFLCLNVPNLWRLEAQSGVFLFCPYDNIEHFYDIDRIVFPYTRSVFRPTPDEVYPVQKSQLEILLDQYFMIEKLREGNLAIQEQVAQGLWTVHIKESRDRWDPDLVVADGPPPLPSWRSELLQSWLNPDIELYSHVRSTLDIVITVPPQSIALSSSREALKKDIRNRVSSLTLARRNLVKWKIQFEDSNGNQIEADGLIDIVGKLWDGLRNLPYEMEDLAEGIANCVLVAIVVQSDQISDSANPWLQAASACFGDSIEVEFGSNDSSYTRGYVGRDALLSAVRSDIADFLNPDFRNELLGNITGLLQAVQDPSRLFDFNRLAKLFAQQLAPSQVLIRGDSAIFYSPARIDGLGLP